MFYQYEHISLYYEVYGSGKKSIVILPGWGDTRSSWYPIIQFLQDSFTVYIVDYPGFGKSSLPKKDLTIYDYSDLIYEWMRELELDNPILIGHSFGGRIIITLTGYYHYHFSDIILMSSAGIPPKKTWHTVLKNFSYKALRKLGHFFPKKIRKKYFDKLFSLFASDDYKSLDITMRTTFKNVIHENLTSYLSKIDARVLLIWGNKDHSTPIRDATIMHQNIKESELIVLDQVGHFPYLERLSLIVSILYEQLKDSIS